MNTLNSRHFLFFIPAVIIVSMKTYVTVFTRHGGRDSWISTIIALIIVFVFLFYLLSICKKKNCYDIILIYQKAFGKIVGNILLVLFYMSIFLTLLECTSVEADAMKYNFLIYNPVWGFLLVAVLAGLYVVILGYRSVLVTVCLGIIFISTSGMILAGLTQKYKDFQRLLPILENGITGDFLISIVKFIASLSTIIVIFPLLKDIRDKENIMKMSIIGYSFVAEVHIVSITGAITTFEPALLNTFPFPKLTQTQRIMHFQFLEAGELFVMLQIIGGWIVKFTVTFFILDQMLRRIGIKKRSMTVFIALLVYLVSWAAAENLFDLFVYLEIYLYIILVNFFIIPLMAFFVFSLRVKTAENRQKNDNSEQNTESTQLTPQTNLVQ